MDTRTRTLLKRAAGARRLRPHALRLGAPLRDRAGRRAGPDLARLPQGPAARRPGARCYLYGYGSYGFPLPVSFSSNRLSLLDRGVVFALAHIRGGGEMGKPWHDDGRMMKKKNTFTDFIAVRRAPGRASSYTSPDRLVIEGGSAGGLLMGAVANMRPDLFKAVVSKVPFVDVINTMLDASLPLTVGEYEEWGNPQEKEDYDYMPTLLPLHEPRGRRPTRPCW